MDPTESTLLFNETEPRILMKRQVAVTGNTSQTASFVESGIFVPCIVWCPEGAFGFPASLRPEPPATWCARSVRGAWAAPSCCTVCVIESDVLAPPRQGVRSSAQGSLAVKGTDNEKNLINISLTAYMLYLFHNDRILAQPAWLSG